MWHLPCRKQPCVQEAHKTGAVMSLVSKTDRVRLGMMCSTSAGHAGKLGFFLKQAVMPICFERRSRKFTALAPLGERVACNRRFHQSVSRRRRVRGSKQYRPKPNSTEGVKGRAADLKTGGLRYPASHRLKGVKKSW